MSALTPLEQSAIGVALDAFEVFGSRVANALWITDQDLAYALWRNGVL